MISQVRLRCGKVLCTCGCTTWCAGPMSNLSSSGAAGDAEQWHADVDLVSENFERPDHAGCRGGGSVDILPADRDHIGAEDQRHVSGYICRPYARRHQRPLCSSCATLSLVGSPA